MATTTCTCTCSTNNLEAVQANARDMLPDSVVKRIDKAMASEYPSSHLINVLHRLQAEIGYLRNDHMDAVAQLLRVPATDVTGVASFYHFFRLKPVGKCVINVCTGTACYVKGASKLLRKLQEELGVDMDETTTDGMFTLQQARCLGMCGLAPVLTMNEDVYDNVKPEDIPVLLETYIRKANKEK